MSTHTYLGINFSGGAGSWRTRRSNPTVWIATIQGGARLRLVDLRPVQHLPGEGEPFERLVTLLRTSDFVAAGIDAPFAVPAEHLPPGGHAELLEHVAALSPAPDRPFPSGAALVELAEKFAPMGRSKKPYRETERVWAGRGVNTRSTLWNGPRGGAPFTAACLMLLARADRPVWPWHSGPGMLVEAFPAAQLKVWGLPHGGYSKPDQREIRERILAFIAERLVIAAADQSIMLGSPDALDAVIAGFAGIAAEETGAPSGFPADGLISVAGEASSSGAPAAGFHSDPAHQQPQKDELFEELLRRPGVRVERIVSRRHVTPSDKPYVQSWDEWVIVLEGSARLSLQGIGSRSLYAGQHLLIPAGVPHLVTYTADPTVWLAIHFGDPQAY
jgi:cupin 2 domain-containing protein